MITVLLDPNNKYFELEYKPEHRPIILWIGAYSYTVWWQLHSASDSEVLKSTLLEAQKTIELMYGHGVVHSAPRNPARE